MVTYDRPMERRKPNSDSIMVGLFRFGVKASIILQLFSMSWSLYVGSAGLNTLKVNSVYGAPTIYAVCWTIGIIVFLANWIPSLRMVGGALYATFVAICAWTVKTPEYIAVYGLAYPSLGLILLFAEWTRRQELKDASE